MIGERVCVHLQSLCVKPVLSSEHTIFKGLGELEIHTVWSSGCTEN